MITFYINKNYHNDVIIILNGFTDLLSNKKEQFPMNIQVIKI